MANKKQQKPRILAVDDSRVMRRAMSKVLSQDYDVVETENGEDAWTVLLNDDSIQMLSSEGDASHLFEVYKSKDTIYSFDVLNKDTVYVLERDYATKNEETENN